jgi:hypothetical protein
MCMLSSVASDLWTLATRGVIYVYAIKKVASYVYAMKSSRARVCHAPEVRWRICHFGWIPLGLNSCTHLTCGTRIVKRLLCPCPIWYLFVLFLQTNRSRAPVRAPSRPDPPPQTPPPASRRPDPGAPVRSRGQARMRPAPAFEPVRACVRASS